LPHYAAVVFKSRIPCETIPTFFRKRGRPTLNNILFWDSYLVRPSRWIDPVLRYSLGKSVLVVWRKPDRAAA